ncbi:MAG: 16S rRNA (uracil(1498)-N(3))-methyltransferase [Pirellulales bacterium]|nr:16S rRNA (uracil(1498)-N(3))-methyltransferase [Pirellulales bacterium]
MGDRYFVDEPILGTSATLQGAEAHHLLHVMRAKPGAEVTLFDGTGAEFPARVTQAVRERVELSILERRDLNRELSVSVTLGVALPKGDRQRWLVEKAVELGVARLVVLKVSRGIVRPNANTLERLRRTVIEASKQCGRNRLMEIKLADFADFVRDAPANTQRYIAHPTTNTDERTIKAAPSEPAPSSISAAIGPEGGFTEGEVSGAIELGWRPLDLGPRILRVETAALAVATLAGLGQLPHQRSV